MKSQKQFALINYKNGEKRNRNVKWYQEKVFSNCLPYLKGSNLKTAIDIGSGNGRMTSVFCKWYNYVMCVDPTYGINSKYKQKGVDSYRGTIKDFVRINKKKFDIVYMIAAFKVLYEYYEDDIFNMINKFTYKGSRIFMEFHLSHELPKFPNQKAVKWYNVDSIRSGHLGKPNIPKNWKIIFNKNIGYFFGKNYDNVIVILEKMV